jgi:hypothetical protein
MGKKDGVQVGTMKHTVIMDTPSSSETFTDEKDDRDEL